MFKNIAQMQKLTMDEGLKCIQRFRSKERDNIKVWSNCYLVAELATQVMSLYLHWCFIFLLLLNAICMQTILH